MVTQAEAPAAEILERGRPATLKELSDRADWIRLETIRLIEQAGFAKGDAMGGAGISSRHTLALINRGGATAGEILALAEKIKDAVRARFAISLEMEPVLVGFD